MPDHGRSAAAGPSTGGLGDIMGGSNFPTASLAKFSPLQRVVLTANGNLQRLVSSYHDATVDVTIRHNRLNAPGVYEREVDLTIFGVTFARCTSTVRVDRDDYVRAIESGGVAIGQLFRKFHILPSFELHAFGVIEAAAGAKKRCRRTDDAAAAGEEQAPAEDDDEDAFRAASLERFWRRYTLSGEGVTCQIYEEIRSDLFALEASEPSEPHHTGPPPPIPPSLGDIMAPATTFSNLPEGFTPLQRLLLTANGNVERVLSSYHNQQVQLLVVLNHKRENTSATVYDREARLLLDNRTLMTAKSTCFLTDATWSRVMEEERLPVGALFRRFNVLPTFTLHSAGIMPGGFWRQYQLRAEGLTCEINETFDAGCYEGKPGSSRHGSSSELSRLSYGGV